MTLSLFEWYLCTDLSRPNDKAVPIPRVELESHAATKQGTPPAAKPTPTVKPNDKKEIRYTGISSG